MNNQKKVPTISLEDTMTIIKLAKKVVDKVYPINQEGTKDDENTDNESPNNDSEVKVGTNNKTTITINGADFEVDETSPFVINIVGNCSNLIINGSESVIVNANDVTNLTMTNNQKVVSNVKKTGNLTL